MSSCICDANSKPQYPLQVDLQGTNSLEVTTSMHFVLLNLFPQIPGSPSYGVPIPEHLPKTKTSPLVTRGPLQYIQPAYLIPQLGLYGQDTYAEDILSPCAGIKMWGVSIQSFVCLFIDFENSWAP